MSYNSQDLNHYINAQAAPHLNSTQKDYKMVGSVPNSSHVQGAQGFAYEQQPVQYEQNPSLPPRPMAQSGFATNSMHVAPQTQAFAYEQQPIQYEQNHLLPPRPIAPSGFATNSMHVAPQTQAFAYEQQPIQYEQNPSLPPRPIAQSGFATNTMQGAPQTQNFASLGDDHSETYLRDPHKLIGYLVPFPLPHTKKSFFHPNGGAEVPQRFLIYTPPPPPLFTPAEGEKESKAHKVQRKWQEEVRQAKTTPGRVTSWKGLKGRVTKGISAAMNQTTSSNLDFLNRIPGMNGEGHDKHADDGHDEGDETHKTVGLEQMVLFYPSSLPGSPEQVRQKFLETMLRSKSQAQKDAIIASGLIPVAAAVDVLATVIWPFGGLLEIDGVWAFSNIRGAKTARGVTKRLHSSDDDNNTNSDDTNLKLVFEPTPRMEILYRYLAAECHKRNPKLFEDIDATHQPTESEVLGAIGWAPSQTGGESRNWEDEQWETQEVKDDFASTMKKGAKEWDNWVRLYENDPDMALKR